MLSHGAVQSIGEVMMILEKLFQSLLGEVMYAEGLEATAQQTQGPSFAEQMLPLLVVGVILYFFIIRPQAKKAKEHGDLLQTLKPGDEVYTSGGIIGRVKSVSDQVVRLDLGSTTIKVVKANIAGAAQGLSGGERS